MTPPTREVTDKREIDPDPVGTAVMRNFALIFVEILFSILPMIILVIVHFYKGTLSSVFFLPEWALVAAVLFGQTIAKITSGAVAFAKKASISYQQVTLSVTLIIVFGLVPSLVVLTLILVSTTPSVGLTIGQLALFVLGIITFFLMGGTMQWEQTRAESVPDMNLLCPEHKQE